MLGMNLKDEIAMLITGQLELFNDHQFLFEALHRWAMLISMMLLGT